MAFDKDTRNQLAALVTQCRRLLTEEFTKQCQSSYGIRADGSVVPMEELTHLSDHDLGTARQLRERIAYLVANDANATTELAIDRMLREQAFTVMNRLAAMRMAEARGLIIESVSKGMESQGFEMYDSLGGAAMGERFDRYQSYLYSMFDELAIDLGVLFDRYSPHGLLFPRETALKEFLDLLNQKAMEGIWAEDETIGWIYQYWNSKEERKAMRDASAAPRNSRELAVRNQFFTPRYVVEFLTDNTLGRIWYEMTKGETRLADQCRYLVRRPTEIFLGEGEDAPDPPEGDAEETLSQEELLKQPVHIPHRPVKDPREIRLLDPACGSMHFGLYAFDLFEAIYEEAWDRGLCPALQEAYGKKEDYLRDVPRLIIEHNIHGVDIDPRAVQIAGLSLWLRAQKTWRDTPPAERPRVRRSNIVCAEPMPGSDAMLEDFVQTLDPPLLGELVKTVFDKMQLAGEAGTLLKIEGEIRTAIDDAKEKWEKLGAAERDLFSAEELNQTLRPGTQQQLTGVEKALTTDHRPLATDFFDTAEERIYAALRDYAESAEAGDYQRRLFAEDAAHGFAFIDLCRKRYDAVVMNPPFGEASREYDSTLKRLYPTSKGNLYPAFILSGCEFKTPDGLLGAITADTFTVLSSFSNFREDLLTSTHTFHLAVDLGWDVLDSAQVSTIACVFGSATNDNGIGFFELSKVDVSRKDFELLAAFRAFQSGQLLSAYLPTRKQLANLPDYMLAYKLAPSVLSAYEAGMLCGGQLFRAFTGVSPSGSERYLRVWWEVPTYSLRDSWLPLAHGGEYSPYYRSIPTVIQWKDKGYQVKQEILIRYPYLNGNYGMKIRSEDHYFSPGATYGKRTDALNVAILPKGCLFSHEGQAVFPVDGQGIWSTLAYLNTQEVRVIANQICASHKVAGYVNKLPLSKELLSVARSETEKVKEIVQLLQEYSSEEEEAREFLEPGLRGLHHDGLIEAWRNQIIANCERELTPLRCINKLHESSKALLRNRSSCNIVDSSEDPPEIASEKLIAVLSGSNRSSFLLERLVNAFGVDADDALALLRSVPDDKNPILSKSFTSLIAWLIGVILGRWDIRYATGERQAPELPDPFDPLPVCPPGMLQNADGLPAAPSDVPDDYPLPITWPGILVSDPGHPEDIVARVRDALAVIWGDRASAIEQEACEILGVRTLRDYFAEKKSGGKFFKDHLKRYSKSRRQAPIYWPLSTESGTYTLWLYYHRLDDQTLYSCIANFVVPKIEQIENDLSRLQQLQQAGQTDAQTSNEVAKLNDLLKELRNFQDELKRLAPIWKPNLNDGVQITAAPLWALFRLKAWQKKLKETWTKLEKGDYDWAHLAYSIWPDRVKEKCIKDKSLAIAHDLEDLYVEPPAKKKAKKK